MHLKFTNILIGILILPLVIQLPGIQTSILTLLEDLEVTPKDLPSGLNGTFTATENLETAFDDFACDYTLSASATEVCFGEAVTLSTSLLGTEPADPCQLPANLQSGLVGYWPFCGDATDASGNGNDGVVYGATLTEDRFGNVNSSFSFNGNNYIEISNVSNEIDNITESISISGWFKTNTASSNQTIIARRNFVGNPTGERHHFELTLMAPDSSLHFSSYDNRDINLYNIQPRSNGSIYSLNQWHHVVASFDKNTSLFKFYYDGQEVYSEIFLNRSLFSFQHWINIGAIHRSGGTPFFSYFNGEIDDVSIFNRSLSVSEIHQLFNLGATPSYSWSTGETTETITVNPTETTDYWVDVTTNGITCRETITITVNTPEAPTGEAAQTVAPGATLADLTVTGDNITWYDAATDGNVLAPTTLLESGTTYYASQTINGCESTERLGVVPCQISLDLGPDQSICNGDSVLLDAGAGYDFYSWSTGETTQTINASQGGSYDVTVGYETPVSNNSSLEFDGVDDYVDMGNSSTFEFENSDFSISFWFKTNNLAYQFLIGNYNGNGQYPTWSIGLRPSGVIFNDLRTPGFSQDGVTNVCDGNWHYLSFSRSRDSFKYYIDGNLEMDVTHLLTNGDVSNGANLIIGKANVLNNSFYKGGFDLLEIWNTPLNQQQIQQYMNCPPTGNETGLVGYWNFEEGSGTTATDLTSNGNNGTLVNGPTWSTDVPNQVCASCTASDTVVITQNEEVQAPTADAIQTFCDATTVGDLVATGESIQWYDAAAGGNPLSASDVLTDGQIVYASQTVNGCESTERTAVSVVIPQVQITASADAVCVGENLSLSLITSLGKKEGTLINELNHVIRTNTQQVFNTSIGTSYRLEISGNWTWGTYCPRLAYDPAYVLNGFYGNTTNVPRSMDCSSGTFSSIFCAFPNLRPIPDEYNANHTYDYYFIANSNQITVGFNDSALGDNCGAITFRLFENSSPIGADSINWSTGETTETITVNPTETTDYWVDVTTNGVTCRETYTVTVTPPPTAPVSDGDITECAESPIQAITASATVGTGQTVVWYDAEIDGNEVLDPSLSNIDTVTYWAETVDDTTGCVSAARTPVTLTIEAGPEAPTADATQTFCDAATVADLVATGESIQWYDTATGGNLLSESDALSDGQIVYASQTVNGCESTERTAVSVVIPQVQITASADEVCVGDEVILSINAINNSINNSCQLPESLQQGLEAYWPFCGDLLDGSGNNRNGSWVGTQNYTTDRFGNLNSAFQGGAAYATFPSSSFQYNQSDSFSIGFWFTRSNNAIGGRLLSSENPEGNLRITKLGTDQIAVQFGDYIYIPVSDLEWHQITYTYNNREERVYLDGVLAATNLEVSTFNPNHGTFTIGAKAAPAFDRWDAKVDDVVIYNRVLTASEINLLYTLSDSTYEWSTGETTETITVNPTETTDYWVDVTTNGVTCRETYTINVTPPPAAPVSDGDITECAESPIQTITASATVGTGQTVVWYDAETDGNVVADPSLTAIDTVTYWAETVDNVTGCVSATRTPVTLTIEAGPESPTADAIQTFCDTVTVADLVASGESIQWYDAATGGNPLSAADSLTDGQIVYASQTVNGCESSERTAVSIVIPQVQITASADGLCAGEEVTLSLNSLGTTIFNSCQLPSNLQNGIVAFWPFCGDGNDASGNENNLQVFGVTSTEDRFGNPSSAFSFTNTQTSVTNYLKALDPNPLALNQYTLQAWVKNRNFYPPGNLTFAYEQIIAFGPQWWNLGPAYGLLIGNSNNQLAGAEHWTPQATWRGIGGIITNEEWHHVASTYDGSVLKFFLNGKLTDSITTGISYDGQIQFIIGGRPDGPFPGGLYGGFNGTMDDVAVYNRALTPEEIQQLFSLSESLYEWSTGETTETITVNPTETTDYWVDITTNGVTCRETYTVTVTPPPTAPVSDGDITECAESPIQTITASATVGTGQTVVWFDAETDGNEVVDPSLSTIDTITYWAETVDDTTGCVSAARTPVTLTIEAGPEAPTADATQTFCDAATVADLVATGESIQWYDEATGGNLLSAADSLTDGQIVYASQTVNGCESSERTAVSIVIPQVQITASADEVCVGEEVTLSLNSATSSINNSCQLPESLQQGLEAYWPFCGNTNDESGNNNLTVVGPILDTDRYGNLESAYFFNGVQDNAQYLILNDITNLSNSSFTYSVWFNTDEFYPTFNDNNPFTYTDFNTQGIVSINSNNWDIGPAITMALGGTGNDKLWMGNWTPVNNLPGYSSNSLITINNWFHLVYTYTNGVGEIYLNGEFIDQFDTNLNYSNQFDLTVGGMRNGTNMDVMGGFNGKIDDLAIWNRPLSQEEIQQLFTLSASSYEWSTGETTETITVNPTETTDYWVDVTTNGVTCRETYTVTVTPPPTAPVSDGDITECAESPIQAITASATVGTGQTVVWYDAETDGNVVADPSLTAIDTVTYWAETLDDTTGCNSATRTPVNLTIEAGPESPTADAIQTFCDTATVADLVASGESIQWYDAATGGNLLSAADSLTDGQIAYASQTVNGCESTERTAVSVVIPQVQITVSTDEVCVGDEVTLSLNSLGTTILNSCQLPSNLQSGLIGYWPFCGNANDASGNGNDGIVYGPTLTSDRFGNSNQAFNFNRNNLNYISSSISNLPILDSPRTVAAWVKWSEAPLQNASHIVNYGPQTPSEGTSFGIIIFGASNWYSYSHGLNDLNSNVQANTNWNFVVTTYSNNSRKIFINGVLGSEDNFALNTTSSDFIIGKASYSNTTGSTNYFDGDIDDIGLWNRALSQEEIQQLFTLSASSYEWSTGATTSTITVNPTETTDYWVDVTTNGVTCRETYTINVTPPPTVPVSDGDITECAESPIQTITASATVGTGQTVVWYDAETDGNEVVDPSLSTIDTITYWAETVDDTTGCVSAARTPVTLTIEAGPEAPTADAIQTFCDTATVADLVASGESIQWYDAATGGNLLSAADSLTDGQIVYASETVNGCESIERTAVSVVIPQVQITASVDTVCVGEEINLSLTSTSAIANTCQLPESLQNGLLGYWPFCGDPNDASGNGNNGNLVGVDLTTDRFGNNNSAYNFDGYAYIGVADNEIFELTDDFTISSWFNAYSFAQVNPILSKHATGTDGDGSYVIGIWQDTDTYKIVFQATPEFSTISYPSILGAVNTETWYNFITTYRKSEGTLQYYLNGQLVFENQINYTILDTPRDLLFGAEGGNLTFFYGDLDDIGIWNRALSPEEIQQLFTLSASSYQWSTGETTETITVNPTETTDYWVDVTTNGVTCRETYTVTVTPPPTAPVSDGDITACAESPIQIINASATVGTGQTIVWYDAETNGNEVVDPSLTTIDTVTYWAETVDDVTGCVSTTRTPVTLTIEATPEIPTTGGDQEVCEDGTSQTLTATASANAGETIVWYDAANGGNIVANPSLSSIGTVTYYAEAVDDTTNCTSISRAAVTLTLLAVPDAPVSNGNLEECATNPLQTLTASATVSAGESLFWYDAPTGGNVVADPSLNTIGTITYYAEAVDDSTNCVSLTRTAVTLSISDALSPPVSGGDIEECVENPTQTLTASATVSAGQQVVWYDAPTGGTVVADPSLNTLGTVTYYTEANIASAGCISLSRTPVTLTLLPVPDAPGSEGNQEICEDGTLQTLTATATAGAGESVVWYDAAIGGSVVTDPSISAVGAVTYYSAAVNDASGCESLTRTAVSLTIITAPDAPISNGNLEVCATSPVQTLTASATVGAGQTLVWYDAATGGNVVVDPSLNSFGTVTYYAEAVDDVTNCVSLSRTEVTLSLIQTPDAPITGGNQEICEDGTQQTLTATATANSGETIVWYDAVTGGNVVTEPVLSAVGTVTYFAAAVNETSACESLSRSAVTLTILAAPDAPVSDGDVAECATNPLQTLTASATVAPDQTLVWYDAPIEGSVVADPSLNAIGTVTYYAEAIDDSTNCVSLTRTAVTLSISDALSPPVSGGDIEECVENPIQTLTASATVNAGQQVIWYDAPTGGTVVADPSLNTLGTVTYYAEANIASAGCISLSRTPVTLTLLPVPDAPSSGGNQEICEDGTLQTLTATAGAGESVVWYDAAIGGSVVTDPSISAVGAVTYYAAAVNDASGCESLTRTAVNLTIIAAPEAPISNGNLEECATSPLQTLTASATVGAGQTLVWYDAATGGNVVVDPSLNSFGTVAYYAEAVDDVTNCVSLSRTAVTLTLLLTPDAPTSGGNQEVCEDGTPQTLTATATANAGETIVWYDAVTGGNLVTEPVLSAVGTVTYFASAVNETSACESLSRSAVTLTILAAPDAPVSDGDVAECATNPPQTLTASATVAPGQTLVWYDAPIEGSVVADPSLNTIGEVTYYAEAIDDSTNCVSLTRTAVTLGISDALSPPVSGGDIEECVENPTQTLTASATVSAGQQVVWYDAPTGGTVVADPSLNTLGTIIYYAEANIAASGCSSLTRTAVTLTLLPVPDAPSSGGNQEICEDGTLQTLTATATAGAGESVVWYDAAVGGSLISNPELNTVGTVTYYAETVNDATGCVSPSRTPVSLTIIPAPNAPVSAGDIAACASNPIQTLIANATVGESENLIWYDAAVGGNLVANPVLNSIGSVTYYAEAVDTTTGCVSLSRTPVTLTITDALSPPVSDGDISECIQNPTQTITASATAGNGQEVVWYNAPTGGTVVSDPSLNTLGTVTYYAEATIASSGCSSLTRTAVTLTLLPVPDAPVSGGDQELCEDGTLQTLTATATAGAGESVVWYDAATAGSIVSDPSISAVGTVTYYAAAANDTSGCESLSRTAVTLTILAAPAAPISNGNVEECTTSPVQTLTASATVGARETLVWYDSATGGSVVVDPSLNTFGTVTYYAEAVDNTTNCISLTRTPVTLTIAEEISPPVSAGDVAECLQNPAQTLTATASVTASLQVVWYDAPSGGNIVTDPSLNSIGTVTYFAEALDTETNCTSLSRTSVTLTLYKSPEAPISNGNIEVCSRETTQTITATASVLGSEQLVWFDTPTGGNVVSDPILNSIGTITYYAEAVNTITGCISETRTPVTLTIKGLPLAPEGDSIQSFCYSALIGDLEISGLDIKWYDALTGGNELTNDYSISDGQMVYASQTADGCESIERLAITVSIGEVPMPEIGDVNLEFCANSTLADVQIDNQGLVLEWYNAPNATISLDAETILEDGTTYYATLFDPDSGCESPSRLAITTTVIPCGVKIYNALSVNNDGENDYMVIENAGYYPNNRLEVYNRDGQLVFEMNGYGLGDNLFYGRANVPGVINPGSNLPTGAYLYVFRYFDADLSQEAQVIKGTLTINSN